MPSKPRVVLVVVPRERFSRSDESLASLHANTPQPFERVYVDGGSPPEVRARLERAASTWGFELIRREEYLHSNRARNLGFEAALVRNPEYVVFLDNDIEFRPDWLAHLLDCADTTGATGVSPLIFHGGFEHDLIHCAGGSVGFTEVEGRREYRNWQRFAHRSVHECSSELVRARWDNFEFHAVLFRTAAIKRFFPLDEQIASLYHHDDLALQLQAAGEPVYMEPDAQVTYRFDRLEPLDLDFALRRWSDGDNDRSVRYFAQKWACHPDGPWIQQAARWAARHRRRITGEPVPLAERVRTAVGQALRVAGLRGGRGSRARA
jgi:GT2 family glycosyltransferase